MSTTSATSTDGERAPTRPSGAGPWLAALGAGLVAGLGGGFVMTVVMTLLRLLAGVPLPGELGADRFLPLLPVFTFLNTIGRFGGNVHAKELAFWSGFAGQVALGAALGVVYAAIVERERGRAPERRWAFGVNRRGATFVAVVVAVLWIVSLAVFWPVLAANFKGVAAGWNAVVTVVGLLVSYASYGLALVLIYRAMTNRAPLRQRTVVGPILGRRAILASGVGVVAALASGGLVRALFQRGTFGYDGIQYISPAMQPITPIEHFYSVTKNLVDPAVAKDVWRLDVAGLVDHPHTYDFAGIAALPSVTQTMTLECISNPVGGGLMGNAVWKGVPLRAVIEAAGPKAGVVEVLLHAADGYNHTVAFDKAMEPTTVLAYEMNGVTLPQRHGYPVRLLVPGYYGEGSVKWITRVELLDHSVERTKDYYGQQGWSDRHVHTWSRFDYPHMGSAIKLAGATMASVHGTAFAGDRGISKVEVSTDGGHTWREAEITYHPSRLAWALWRYDWRPGGSGAYHLLVRATDGQGTLQETTTRIAPPQGSSGYQRVSVRVEA
jgi:DMSO/TMAO reductase YedYZ molybdopterin-dependent catalytic subunit